MIVVECAATPPPPPLWPQMSKRAVGFDQRGKNGNAIRLMDDAYHLRLPFFDLRLFLITINLINEDENAQRGAKNKETEKSIQPNRVSSAGNKIQKKDIKIIF